MYRNLINKINMQDWTAARKELETIKSSGINEYDDTLCILAATIFQHEHNEDELFYWITSGLQYNPQNYELYLLLGNYYENKNLAQAWLCYENAEFYCSNKNDAIIISDFKNNAAANLNKVVRKLAIIILSYNKLDMIKECIESIRRNNPSSSYELIIVDNASEDGSKEWLMEQNDIKLICNTENMGFPYGCNQGIKEADNETDIFLLNNDTIVTPNSIFWLRMGLYSGTRIGATGSVSNRASNGQIAEGCGNNIQSCMQYAHVHNIPMKYPYEKKLYLIGFALMIKREAIDETGLLDTRFSPGTYEDNDYCIRLHNAGWEVLLCKNSFIFHNVQVQSNMQLWSSMHRVNSNKFIEKWHFKTDYYSFIRTELIDLIKDKHDSQLNILEIGCGFGATLCRILSVWGNSSIHGIELEPEVAKIASTYIDVIQGNAETMPIPYNINSFDYIILGDVLEHLVEPRNLLMRFIPYLKQSGMFLCSIPNIMHTSVLFPLLFEGKFDYKDSGILDRTHLRFFTLESINMLFKSCHLKIQDIYSIDSCSPGNEQKLDTLINTFKLPSRQQFTTYQYILSAKK